MSNNAKKVLDLIENHTLFLVVMKWNSTLLWILALPQFLCCSFVTY